MNEQLLLTSDQEYELAFEDARFNTSHLDCRDRAIMRLQRAAERSERFYHQPLLICYSGGKDSDAVVQLAFESGIDFEVVHSHTTADAPETVRYVRQRFKEWEDQGIKCSIEYPYYKGKRTSMWALIPQKKMPPTRLARYCCEVLKETSGQHRACATGVRWSESTKRQSRGINESMEKRKEEKVILMNDNADTRKLEERCVRSAKTLTNPIIDWTDKEVFNYLRDKKAEINPLYYCGLSRIGCIGCPMASTHRYEQFRQFPKYKDMYIRAFDKMIKSNPQLNYICWKNGKECFDWWMGEDPNQLTLFGELEED